MGNRGAGRPPGSPNRKSMVVTLSLSNLGFDTIKEYIKAYNELLEPRDKIVALTTLMKYQFPQLKEIEYREMLATEMDALETTVDPAEIETSDLLKELNVTPIKRL